MVGKTGKVSISLIVWIFSAVSCIQLPSSDEKLTASCAKNETKCYYGCCPYANATCCLDRYQCCQHGETCIPGVGICINSEGFIQPGKAMKTQNYFQNSTTASDSNKVDLKKTECSSQSTECGEGCCPYAYATCCSDNLHCCPRDYYCDFETSTCIGNRTERLEGGESKAHFDWCPDDMTDCGFSSCCPLAEAVCCTDRLHCCPKGYSCDLQEEKCTKTLADVFMHPVSL